MQDEDLVRGFQEAREILDVVFSFLQEVHPRSPMVPGAFLDATEVLDRVRPVWALHHGPTGAPFPLDRLVCLVA